MNDSKNSPGMVTSCMFLIFRVPGLRHCGQLTEAETGARIKIFHHAPHPIDKTKPPFNAYTITCPEASSSVSQVNCKDQLMPLIHLHTGIADEPGQELLILSLEQSLNSGK